MLRSQRLMYAVHKLPITNIYAAYFAKTWRPIKDYPYQSQWSQTRANRIYGANQGNRIYGANQGLPIYVGLILANLIYWGQSGIPHISGANRGPIWGQSRADHIYGANQEFSISLGPIRHSLYMKIKITGSQNLRYRIQEFQKITRNKFCFGFNQPWQLNIRTHITNRRYTQDKDMLY